MPDAPAYYAEGPEPLVVGLAARGDRDAFTELVRRRQPWVRNLMRRFSGDSHLADDLSQRVFLQVWRKIRQVRHPERFGGWIKRIAVNEWIEHQRRNDADRNRDYDDGAQPAVSASPATAMDLDKALATLPAQVRLCIVLSYHERMTHEEIAELTGMQLGTVKSHIRRGSEKLRDLLSAYGVPA
ncbi:MAG: sigma-70 family RNA polymerase sigma factor [Gammaproteobacteria bacterium]|nr:MAG: sigma-70 family RNA polymerase sigma factor [Gammaproteobacteria bacterium]